jgi:hypothetical protein
MTSRCPAQRMQRSPAELDPLLLWPALGLLLFGHGDGVFSSSIALAEGSRFTGYQSAYFLYAPCGLPRHRPHGRRGGLPDAAALCGSRPRRGCSLPASCCCSWC